VLNAKRTRTADAEGDATRVPMRAVPLSVVASEAAAVAQAGVRALTATTATSTNGAHTLAMLLLGSSFRMAQANAPPLATVNALVAAATPFFAKAIDDDKLSVAVHVPLSFAELDRLEAYAASVEGRRLRVVRAHDVAAAAAAAAQGSTRVLVCETDWRHRCMTPAAKLIEREAGDGFAARVHALYPLPAEPGSVHRVELSPIAPLRMKAGCEWLLLAVPPVFDTESPDAQPLSIAQKTLQHAYAEIFRQFLECVQQ